MRNSKGSWGGDASAFVPVHPAKAAAPLLAAGRSGAITIQRERGWDTMAHPPTDRQLRQQLRGCMMTPDGSVGFAGVWRE